MPVQELPEGPAVVAVSRFAPSSRHQKASSDANLSCFNYSSSRKLRWPLGRKDGC